MHFWDAQGCAGAESEGAGPLPVDAQSDCIVPLFNGTFHSMKPPQAQSAQVKCTFGEQ